MLDQRALAEGGNRPAAEDTSHKLSLVNDERAARLLVDGIIDYAIYLLDPNGVISNWNAGAQRIKGYRADEVVGRHFGMFYTPEDQARGAPHHSLETARSEGRFAAEGWRVRKDGSRFMASVVIDAVREGGRLVGFAKITRDLSERQALMHALKDSERHFRLLVEGVTDYALYMLDPAGYVTSWNTGGVRIKGYAPEEIIGQHFSRFYTEADRAAGRPERALSLARELGHYEAEGWRVRKAGSIFWASVVLDPIRDDDGRLIGYAKITRDITERKDAQTALERVQRQLAESQKMDALGQLTGGVAHDFNNLLMVVTGHIHTLKGLATGNPRAERAAQAIELAAQRGATLTRQLLTFSRRQPVNPEPVDVHQRIESIREVLVSGLGKGANLDIGIAPNAWPVIVDTSELEIALVNLVINARDAMPDGGTVTINTQNVVMGDEEGLRAGDYLALTVRDSGVGIPPDVLTNVFDPFFTTKPIGKGTGLGLSQVHGFAHQAGGTVKIESELGQGTTVTILLPRSLANAGASGAQPDSGVDQPVPGTVLLVEDNPEVAHASTSLLEQLGYSVRWVTDAESALAELGKNDVDIMLSDIIMPGRLDGLGLARLARQEHPDLPILLATGYSEAARNVRADFPILRKPYEVQELGRALSRLPGRAAKAKGA